MCSGRSLLWHHLDLDCGRTLRLLVEWLLLVLPQVLLCMGALPVKGTVLWLLFTAVALHLPRITLLAQKPIWKAYLLDVAQSLEERRKTFLTLFRGGLMLYTCIGILAVDFPAFPRRYAKTEHYGTGLMDVGVGGIIFAGGLVTQVKVDSERVASNALSWGLLKGSGGVLSLLALGLGRLVATWGVDYQVHVGEYGTHWNFFLTVAAVRLMTGWLLPPAALLYRALTHSRGPHRGPSAGPHVLSSTFLCTAGLLVGGIHQLVLSHLGLEVWVHQEDRGPQWWHQNKEGVASVPGYWSLFLLGAGCGGLLRDSTEELVHRRRARLTQKEKPSTAAGSAHRSLGLLLLAWGSRLALGDLFLWLALGLLEYQGVQISRRSCNLAYILWICALCLLLVILCVAVELTLRLPQHARAPILMRQEEKSASLPAGPADHLLIPQAFNRNLLAVFLVANLLTGLVNVVVNTLETDNLMARLVVTSYMMAVCLVAVLLDAWDIVVKLG